MRVLLVADGSHARLQRDLEIDALPDRNIRIRFSDRLVLAVGHVTWDVKLSKYVITVYHSDEDLLTAHGFYTPA